MEKKTINRIPVRNTAGANSVRLTDLHLLDGHVVGRIKGTDGELPGVIAPPDQSCKQQD